MEQSVERESAGEIEVLEKKTVLMPLRPPQISHNFIYNFPRINYHVTDQVGSSGSFYFLLVVVFVNSFSNLLHNN
jgi:hypothetical protein